MHGCGSYFDQAGYEIKTDLLLLLILVMSVLHACDVLCVMSFYHLIILVYVVAEPALLITRKDLSFPSIIRIRI